MKNRKGNIIVFAGPSGVGKGSILSKVLKEHNDIVLSVSATTRSPRPGEKEGIHYYFKSKEEFQKLIDDAQMLEWAEFAGNYYGTFISAVESEINSGRDVILEIEVQGAMQVKEKMPDVPMIFISPPSDDELRARLKGRGTEPDDVVAKRLAIAENELTLRDKFDYNVVNDDLDEAVIKVESIILSLRG